jgi:hypothetical protein
MYNIMRKTNFYITVIVVSTIFVLTLVVFSLTGDVGGGFSTRNGAPETTAPSVTGTLPIEPTPSPTPGPSPTPTPIPDYIPEFESLPEKFWIDTMTTTLDGLSVSESELGYSLFWTLDEKADYYIFCSSENGAEYHPLQILSPEVGQWEYMAKDVAGFMVLAYTDDNREGTEDDELILAYRSPMYEPVIDPNAPADTGDNPTDKYKIIVDKEDCAFAVFEKDGDGEYTVMVATFPAALGGRKTPLTTERRTFTIGRKLEWRRWTGFSPDRFSPYASQYSAGIFFHGPIYRRQSFDTLMKYSYDDIGSDYKTGGCVRTTVAGARFVYYACPAGTVVEVLSSTDLVSYPDKSPIDPDFPSWDPTDPQKPTPSPTPNPTPTPVTTPTSIDD